MNSSLSQEWIWPEFLFHMLENNYKQYGKKLYILPPNFFSAFVSCESIKPLLFNLSISLKRIQHDLNNRDGIPGGIITGKRILKSNQFLLKIIWNIPKRIWNTWEISYLFQPSLSP